MAVLWSLATLLCAIARNYQQMLAGRLLVGVGEAAYGSVGIAVVVSVFPKRLRATLSAPSWPAGCSARCSASASAGQSPPAHGWRTGVPRHRAGRPRARRALSLAGRRTADRGLCPRKLAMQPYQRPGSHSRSSAACLAGRTIKCAYVGSGLQLFVAGALPAWLPTYFNRYYGLPVDRRRLARRPVPRHLRHRHGGLRPGQRPSVQPPRPAGPARGRLQPRLRHSAQRCAGASGRAGAAHLRLALAIFLAAATTRPGRRDGRQPDARGDPRHGLRHADTGQQFPRALRPARSSPAGWPIRSGLLGGLALAAAWPSIAAALVFLCARQSSRADLAFAE